MYLDLAILAVLATLASPKINTLRDSKAAS